MIANVQTDAQRMMTHMVEVAEQQRDAAKLRDQAAAKDAEAAASFERCDTDGYMTQWAGGIMADKLRLEADLVEAGGMIEVEALFNLDGTIASTHWATGKYGEYWVLNDASAGRLGRFVSTSSAAKGKTRYNNNRKKGFTLGTIRVRGYVDLKGANVTSVRAYTLPVVDDLKSGAYTIVTADKGVEQDW